MSWQKYRVVNVRREMPPFKYWVLSPVSYDKARHRSPDYRETPYANADIHGHQHVNQAMLVGRTQVMGVCGQRRI